MHLLHRIPNIYLSIKTPFVGVLSTENKRKKHSLTKDSEQERKKKVDPNRISKIKKERVKGVNANRSKQKS